MLTNTIVHASFIRRHVSKLFWYPLAVFVLPKCCYGYQWLACLVPRFNNQDWRTLLIRSSSSDSVLDEQQQWHKDRALKTW